MADNKRQGIGAKAQGQQAATSSAAMVPTDEALNKAIGGR